MVLLPCTLKGILLRSIIGWNRRALHRSAGNHGREGPEGRVGGSRSGPTLRWRKDGGASSKEG